MSSNMSDYLIEKKKKINDLIQEKARLRRRNEMVLRCLRALKFMKFVFCASLIFIIVYVENLASALLIMGVVFFALSLLERYINHIRNSRKRHLSKINRQIYNLCKLSN